MLLRKGSHAAISPASMLFLWLAAVQLASCTSSAQETVLFVFMTSGTSEDAAAVEKDSSGALPAVEMALERINNRTDLLPGYRLKMSEASPINSECKRSVSLDRFFAEINAPPGKTFLLGCGCSTATEPVAEISHAWKIIHMSYASLSPELDNREQFPNFFRTVPNAVRLVHVIHAVMDQYGWERLAVISEDERLFTLVAEVLQTNFSRANMNLSAITLGQDEDVMVAAQNKFFNQTIDYRIYFLNMYHHKARSVLCAVYKLDMEEYVSPRYVWITLGWYPPRWWTQEVSGDDASVSCTDQELEIVLNRSLVIAQYPNASNPGAPTDVGLTNAEFFQEYGNRSAQGNFPATFSAMFAYDAVWSMAMALNGSGQELNLSTGQGDMDADDLVDRLGDELMDQDFVGISGKVSFDSFGSRRQTSPRVLQYRFESNSVSNDDEPVLIGTVSVSMNNGSANATFMYVGSESNSSVWPEVIPSDGTPIVELRTVLLPLFVILAILATANIIFACVCAVINFTFRKRKVIRLTSPNLNYLIIIGVVMLSLAVYFYSFPARDADVLYGMCIMRAYLQPGGFVFTYVTVCAKMWRVYYIFHNPTTKKKTIKDWQLFLMVMVVYGVVQVYMTLSLILDKDYGPVQVPYTEETPSPNEYGIAVQYEILVCDSPGSVYWISLVFLILYLIVVVSVYFAFRTRKVKIKALNDAKEISAVIYVVCLVLTVMMIAVVVLSDYRNADAAVFSFGILLGTFITLLFIFIPKWRSLYKDPYGENIFERSASRPSFSSGVELTAVERDRMRAMSERISVLEERLSKYESVTPFASRKRFFTSSGALDGDLQTRSLSAAALVKSGVANRSLSFSSSPISPTASLPATLPSQTQMFKFEPSASIIKEKKESPTTTSDSGVNVEQISPNATLEREESCDVLESSIGPLVKNAV